MSKLHRYVVTDVAEDAPANLQVGSVLVVGWHGKSHAFQTEQNGEIKYLCTGYHMGRYEGPKSDAE